MWQDDYYASSVSESAVGIVKAYIQNQEAHHTKVSFTEEVKEFMESYSQPDSSAGIA